MKHFNLAYLGKITVLSVLFVLCASCNNESKKDAKNQSHVEEFAEFKIDIPNQFWHRVDDIDTVRLIQRTVWKEHNGTQLILEFHHENFLVVPDLFINTYEESFLNSAKSRGLVAQDILKTDSTWQCKYYLKNGHYINHYFGAKKVGAKYITYNYTGLYSLEKLLEIINSIKPWKKEIIEYRKYEDISLGCSIDYPIDFNICDTINANKNRIIKFRKTEKLPHENFVFNLSRGKFYDNFLIDNLISHEFVQSDKHLSKRYIILQDVGLLGNYKAYRFSDLDIISGMPKGAQKCYSVYFIAHEDEYYIIKFGDHINEIMYKNANKIRDILNSFRITK